MSSPIPEILVADDSPENLAWVVETLEGEGFRVRPADSGALALASARLKAPDLVLLDVRMEGMDGYEVCTQLKADPVTRDVPVLFVSGLSDVQDRVRGFEVGASDFLLKPLRKEDLLARVGTFLALADTKRKLEKREEEVESFRGQLQEEQVFRLGAQTILDETPALVFATDLEGRFLLANKALAELLGVPPREVEGKTREDFLPAEIAAAHRADDLIVLSGGSTKAFEERNLEADGEHIYWSQKFPLRNREGRIIGVGGIASDITALRRLEQERARLTDLFATLSQANKAIVRCQSEQELMQEICRVCVEFGHLELAWVGLEEDGRIRPVASFGPGRSYLAGIEIHAGTAGDPLACGPTGTALREECTVLCQDWATDPRVGPWRERAAANGIRSNAAFPVRVDGRVECVLTLYSKELEFFQPDRIALMEELADDLGFALGRFQMERKQREAEEVLAAQREESRLSEDRYRDLVEHSHDLICTHDLEGRLLSVNEAAVRITGYSREAMQGMNMADLLTPNARASFPAYLAEIRSKGAARGLLRLQTADGSKRWLEFHNTIRDDGMATPIVRGMAQDITERKTAEAAFRDSEERFRALFEHSPEAILWADAESGILVRCNGAAERLLGRSSDEIIGQHQSSLHPPAEAEAYREIFAAHAREGSEATKEVEILRKDGQRVPVEIIPTVIEQHGRKLLQGRFIDITQRKAFEAEIQSLNASLEQRVAQRTAELEGINQELEAFAYSVSHDLKAPLRAISGFATALEDEFAAVVGEEGQYYLSRIRGGANHMGELIDDLLRLSRLGRGEVIILPVDLAPMAREALARLREGDPQRTVEARIPDSMQADCDPRLMRVLMENLLENAWKFSSTVPHPRIEITFRRAEDGGSELTVRDNGVGFPMERAHRLFAPFFRMHSPEEFPGTGIGLAIVKRIAARHGGNVRAESHPGQGAAFTVSLPPPPKEAP